ncbi:MAG: terminase [Caulobacteraceae bacterium]|nr:terminase [Caulobacteraceae bacterium]
MELTQEQIIEIQLELRRRDFHRFVASTVPNFVDGWLYQHLCKRLAQFMEDVRNKKSPRLIVCMPPRHLKSESISVRFPLWCLLNNPSWEVIVSTYGSSLSERLSRRARSLMSEQYVQTLWPLARVDPNHFSVKEWKVFFGKNYSTPTTYKAVGRGGSLTGSGAHILICDDLIKDQAEADSPKVRDDMWHWFNSVARTRLTPGGGIIIVNTRWHKDDITGRLIAESENKSGDTWEILNFPAIAEEDEEFRKMGEALHPQRFDVEALLKMKRALPNRWWDSLYQQRPASAGGEILKARWFREFDVAPEMDMIIQSWDLRFSRSQTAGSSFVVGQVWGARGSKRYLLDEMRGRWSYTESRDAIREMCGRWPQATAVLVENKANGPAIESDLEGEVPGLVLYDPRGDKIQRLERVSPLIRAGDVYLPPMDQATWVKDWLAEVCNFPRAPNDDRVDAMSMALAYLHELRSEIGAVQTMQLL